MISRYERDEMTPSIDVAKKLAAILNTTAGYLLDESGQDSVLKYPDMLKRLNDIAKMEKEDKDHIFYVIDGLIKGSVPISVSAAITLRAYEQGAILF